MPLLRGSSSFIGYPQISLSSNYWYLVSIESPVHGGHKILDYHFLGWYHSITLSNLCRLIHRWHHLVIHIQSFLVNKNLVLVVILETNCMFIYEHVMPSIRVPLEVLYETIQKIWNLEQSLLSNWHGCIFAGGIQGDKTEKYLHLRAIC